MTSVEHMYCWRKFTLEYIPVQAIEVMKTFDNCVEETLHTVLANVDNSTASARLEVRGQQ